MQPPQSHSTHGRAPSDDAAARAAAAFRTRFGDPAVLARGPGRINVIGEHVDYSGGLVVPVAVNLDVVVAARPRTDAISHVVAGDLAAQDTFGLADPAHGEGWASYVRGVTWLLREAGVPVPGYDMAIAGDVPRGGGMSSSAALEVAAATALLALAGASMEGVALAQLCRRAETEWAGVSCGIMDQLIAVLGRAGHALLVDTSTLAYRHVPLPASVRIVAVDSGVQRDLRASQYNDRVAATREAAALLDAEDLGHVAPDVFQRRAGELPDPVRRRARHVVTEIQRTRDAARALAAGRLDDAGRLMNASHDSLRDDFEVSIPELDALVAAARRVDGVYGSRLTGAGWGGCTVSLVDAGAVEAFRRRVPVDYREATGRDAVVYVLEAVDGAAILEGPGQPIERAPGTLPAP
ncbi:MAG TPA: galactokinase [Longimicrobiales bacterium]|nr:galactokinase [Longimicrobiales bacterium]